MKSDKKMAILMTVIMAVSVFAAMPVTQAQYPEPDLTWTPINTGYDITDVAIGDLTLNGTDDVAFIDQPYPSAPPPAVYAVYGDNGTEYWDDTNVSGYSIAVGDVDGDTKNEVVAGGYNESKSSGITVFEDNGTVKFFYPTYSGVVKDIELGDVNYDGVDDIVACNNGAGWIYVFNGTDGSDLTGWPKNFTAESFFDVALGELDENPGLDIAAISADPTTLYAFNSTGTELWTPNTTVSGRSVEIGDVDGDTEDEVVIGNRNVTTGYGVYVYDGATGNLEYSFGTGSQVVEIELGDLDGDPTDLEIAALVEVQLPTLYALNVESGNPNLVEMWNFSISWYTDYYGEGLAIGDIDRDYKNEVIAGAYEYYYEIPANAPNNAVRVPVGVSSSYCSSIYAFDGLDSNGDGEGDVVWRYDVYCPYGGSSHSYEQVASEIGVVGISLLYTANDIEVGDIDGDGDMDVIVGTNGGFSVYALSTQEHTADVEGELIYFDSDPSNITDVASVVPMPPDPPEGYNFPYGVFAINITVPVPGQWANITITLPDDLPANAEYWKYSPNGNGSPSGQPGWYQIPLGSNDGDNVITIRLQDGGIGDADGDPTNGRIVDQGGPAIPPERVPAFTPLGIAALVGLLAIIATSTIVRIRKKR